MALERRRSGRAGAPRDVRDAKETIALRRVVDANETAAVGAFDIGTQEGGEIDAATGIDRLLQSARGAEATAPVLALAEIHEIVQTDELALPLVRQEVA